MSAEQSEFIAGMRSAANEVQKFGESSNKHVSSLQKSMEHLAGGRHFSKLMGEIGGALGGNAQLITSAIRNFQHFGPVVGTATTAVQFAVEAYKSYQEAAKESSEAAKAFLKINQEIGRYEGGLFNAGKFESKRGAFAEMLDKKADELEEKGANSMFGDDLLKKAREMRNAAMLERQKGRGERATLDNPMKEFEDNMFDIQKKGRGSTIQDQRERMSEKYQLEMELVDQLTEKMNTLKEGGEEYNEVWKEIKTHTLAAVNLKDEYKASMKKDIGVAAHLSSATSFNAAIISQLQHSGGSTQTQHLAIAQKQLAALLEIKKQGSQKQVAVAGE